jgi:hypothetical protein
MKNKALVVVTLLSVQLARPALAQTSAWDFSAKTPAATATTAAPKSPAAKTETPAKREIAAKKPIAVAARPAAAKDSSPVSMVWDFSPARPAAAPATVAAVPAPSANLATAAPTIARAREEAVSAPIPAATPVVPAPVAALAAAAPAPPPALAQVTKPAEPPRPQPTGLERLSNEWPKAVKVGVQYRGRLEEQRGSSITSGRDDGYYLNRIRLETTVTAAPWLKAYVQIQDAQTLGYDVAAQPTSLTNTLDLRQGYVDARWPSANGFGVRVGRQDISFGEQRLVGGAEWNNTARSFDAVRGSITQPGVQIDAFVSSVVVLAQDAFDQWKTGETLSGTYVSLGRIVPKGVIEPYLFARSQDSVTAERGGVGDGATYTFGVRAAGALPSRVDYGVEIAAQRGHLATDAVGAWAGHYALGWVIVTSAGKPRLVAEFNHASGDSDPADGRRGTFDQLYPTNHNKYGLADQIGWRNMRDVKVGIEWLPHRKLKVNTDVHRLFLATTADGLYTVGGARKVLNRQAVSRTVGTELDVQGAYAFSKELSLGAGVGTLFAGDYLAQSTTAGTLWTPYLMWNLKF